MEMGVKLTRVICLSSFLLVLLMGTSQGHRQDCYSRQFCCSNRECVDSSYLCNGLDDCGDNSDERYCDINNEKDCPVEDGVRWRYCEMKKNCYPSAWVCDGYIYCPDHSDETCCRTYSNCTGSQFSCFNGNCTKRAWFCDDDDDCGDNSDEKYCAISSSTDCPINWNRCSSGTRCYPREWKCDGRMDCQDGSDEWYCPKKNDSSGREIKCLYTGEETEEKLKQYFLSTRRSTTHSTNKWGPHITRTAIALFLTDESFFKPMNDTGQEIAYELSLQLMSKLVLTKRISTQELTLFINALLVACINPREFFGLDMVAELRKRVNDSKYSNPFSILTLCNANDSMKHWDINKLQQLFDAHHLPLWTDTQAMITIALACINNRPNIDFDRRILNEMVAELKRAQHENGTIDNLMTTALVVQALFATGSYGSDFKLKAAMRYILQELTSTSLHFQDMYYVLPLFNSMSLVNISSSHCITTIKTDLEGMSKLPEVEGESIEVQISMYIGNDADFVRTTKIKVPSNYSFYQVLETMGALDSKYKVKYTFSEGKPYVVGLPDFQNNVEDNMFWFIYTKPILSSDKPKLIEQSPVEIQVKKTDELILWYRSGTWIDTQESTSNINAKK